jgi:formate dehydrogenase subunit gamma
LLHAIQDRVGYIAPEAVGLIARAFNRSRAEVHGVISFYHHFRSEPAGRHVVQLCRAEACRACGSEALAAVAEKTLGCASGSTSAGGVTLESVYCLGLCASSPAIAVDGQPRARMDEAQLKNLLQTLEVGT